MEIEKQLQLRPRFEKTVPKSISAITEKADDLSISLKPDYTVKTFGVHIWISVGNADKKSYSPHLHLELEEVSPNETKIKGLYGPDPGLWTLFVFLHFAVAGIFITFGVVAYSNWSLNQSGLMPVGVMVIMAVAWAGLYFTARSNRKKGLPQARELERIMNQILS